VTTPITPSQSALEDYLDNLLEESEADTSNSLKRVSNKTENNIYQLGKEHPKNTEQQRHQIERVERLLDDYNSRAQNKHDDEQSDTKSEVIKPVLEQAVLIAEPEVIEEQVTAEVISENLEPEQEIETDQSPPVEPPIVTTLPEWADKPFQTLLFEVGGLELAIPLISLGGIHRLDEDNEVTTLFGKPDWFMGLAAGLTGNINVVDTCRWVMPEQYAEAKTKGLNYSFMVMLGDSEWGLACSHVQTAVTINPEQIKWRSNNSKRPWLMGMLIEESCVLLDADVIIELLNSNFKR